MSETNREKKDLTAAEKGAQPKQKKQAPKPKQAAGKAVDPDRTPVDGDTVTVEYIGTLPTGFIFDKASPENPFVFSIGAGQVLPKFEAVVKSMKVGEPRTFTVHMLEAYGPYREKMVITVPRDSFPAGERIEIGKRARVADNEGNQEVMRVIELTDDTVKLDGNHPLAGETLVFNNVTITAIN